MTVALCLPLLVSGVLWLAAAPVGRRLPPATAARALTATLLATAAATAFVLAMAALLVLGQLPVIATLGEWSAARLAAGNSGLAGTVGWLAVAVITVLVTATVRRAVAAVRDLATAAKACRSLGPGVEGLVVVEDDTPEAYALPGIPGRVVVSTAMLRALPADERRVLLAHEAAHLRGRHHLYITVADLAAAANPLLRPGAHAVGRAVERWADEEAARQVGDRDLAARALARAGLARAAARRRRSVPALALSNADGDVVDRTRALLAAPPPRRPLLAAAVAGLIAVSGSAVLVTAQTTEDRFEVASSAFANGR